MIFRTFVLQIWEFLTKRSKLLLFKNDQVERGKDARYCYDEAELKKTTSSFPSNASYSIQRFKGKTELVVYIVWLFYIMSLERQDPMVDIALYKVKLEYVYALILFTTGYCFALTGLGEMMPEQLWETTMNPETRILKRLVVDDIAEASMTFSSLMGAQVSHTYLVVSFGLKTLHFRKSLTAFHCFRLSGRCP